MTTTASRPRRLLLCLLVVATLTAGVYATAPPLRRPARSTSSS
jgi:hypothetical protein